MTASAETTVVEEPEAPQNGAAPDAREGAAKVLDELLGPVQQGTPALEENVEAPPVAEPEEPWTQEKVVSEAAKVKEQSRELETKRLDFQKKYSALVNREEKFKHKLSEYKQQRDRDHNVLNWVQNRLEAIRTGDADAKLRALGDLAGNDGAKFYEEISLHMASNGKRQTSPEVQAMRDELKQLRQLLEGRQNQQTEAEQVANWKSIIVEEAKQNTALAHVAKLAEKNPERLATAALRVARDYYAQNNKALDRISVLNTIESELKETVELSQPAAALSEKVTTPSAGETDRDPVASATPEAAQRTPKGQSIPQSLSAGSTKRAANRDERRRAAEALIPEHLIRGQE